MESLTKITFSSSHGLILTYLVQINKLDHQFKKQKRYSLTATLVHIALLMQLWKIYKLSIRNWPSTLTLLKQLPKLSRRFSSNPILISRNSLKAVYITSSQQIKRQHLNLSPQTLRSDPLLLQMSQPLFWRSIRSLILWKPSQLLTLTLYWLFITHSLSMMWFTMAVTYTSISIPLVIPLSLTILRWNQCRELSSRSHLMPAELTRCRLFNS